MVTQNNCDEPTAASGKVLQGQGVGVANAFSTSTYPSTATGTGKILRADGTNFVASTATYPDTAGTSSNVLTSDGTNWVSSASSGGNFTNGFLTTLGSSASLSDLTTYYLVQSFIFNSTYTSDSTQVRYYVPAAFTLTKVYGSFRILGTIGTSENGTLFIRVNNSSNTNISTTIQLNSSNVDFNNTGLSISLNAGDFITFGFTTPTWATNPQTVSLALGWSS